MNFKSAGVVFRTVHYFRLRNVNDIWTRYHKCLRTYTCTVFPCVDPCCSILSAGLCAKMNEENLARLENAAVHVMVSVCVRGTWFKHYTIYGLINNELSYYMISILASLPPILCHRSNVLKLRLCFPIEEAVLSL